MASKENKARVFHGIEDIIKGGFRVDHEFDINCETCRKAYEADPEAFSGWPMIIEGSVNIPKLVNGEESKDAASKETTNS